MTKHRVCLNLNSPPDGQRIEVKVNAYGPETKKLKKDAYEYRSQNLDKIQDDKNKLFGIYVRVKANIKRTSARKVKLAAKVIQDFFDNNH